MRPRIPRVLVVEDNADIARLVKFNLADLPASVTLAADGVSGLAQARAEAFELFVLDVNLPGLSGIELLAQLRAAGTTTPALILTGYSPDRTSPLHQLGPIEWIRKPFGVADLVGRVRRILGHDDDDELPPSEGDPLPTLLLGPLQIDPARRHVTRSGTALRLDDMAFDLLWRLASHPGQVFSRRELRVHLWGAHSEVADHAVNELITKLRSQIEIDPRAPQWIRSGASGGYFFNSGTSL